jgi:hypothetical protein
LLRFFPSQLRRSSCLREFTQTTISLISVTTTAALSSVLTILGEVVIHNEILSDYLTYANGVLVNTTSTLPSLTYDNGTPCAEPAGFSGLEAIDLTTPEPSSLLLVGTGCLSMKVEEKPAKKK